MRFYRQNLFWALQYSSFTVATRSFGSVGVYRFLNISSQTLPSLEPTLEAISSSSSTTIFRGIIVHPTPPSSYVVDPIIPTTNIPTILDPSQAGPFTSALSIATGIPATAPISSNGGHAVSTFSNIPTTWVMPVTKSKHTSTLSPLTNSLYSSTSWSNSTITTNTTPYPYNTSIPTTLQVTSSSSTCTPLSPGQDFTVWRIDPNPATITIYITPNASIASLTTISEFTPPTYCPTPTATAFPSSSTSSAGLISVTSENWGATTSTAAILSSLDTPSASGSGSYTATVVTTTIITTSKNPVVVYTTVSSNFLGFPGSSIANKVTADITTTSVNWGFIGGGPPTPGPTSIAITTLGPDGQPVGTGSSPEANGSGTGDSNSNATGNSPGEATPTAVMIGSVSVVIGPTQVIIGTQTVSIPSSNTGFSASDPESFGSPGSSGSEPGGSNLGGNSGTGGGGSGGSGSGAGGNDNESANVAKTIVQSGQTFTINPSQVIGSGTTISISTNTPEAVFNELLQATIIEGVSITLNPSVAVISGTTYAIGAGAPQTTIVASDRTISLGPGGLGFAQTTVAPPSSLPTNFVVIDAEVFSAIGQSVAVIGSSTFTYGSDIPIQSDNFNGAIIILGPSGISYDGKTLGGAASPTGVQLGIVGGLTITEIGSTIAVVDGATFTIGPGVSSPATAIISGHTITAGTNGLGVEGTTLSYPFNPATEIITAGGITFSEIGSSLVIIGTSTFTIGASATPTFDIYNGQSISIGPGGLGFKTTTVAVTGIAATSTPTSATSAKVTGKKKNGAGALRPIFGVLGAWVVVCLGVLV